MGDFADGYVVGMILGGGGKTEDDWSPPEDWIPVPEPGPWEVYLLIELHNDLTYGVCFANPKDTFIGEGVIIIDWGDGTVKSYDGAIRDESGKNISGNCWSMSDTTHAYEKSGQYVIKITTQKENSFFYESAKRSSYNREGMLIAKLGSNIKLKSDTSNSSYAFSYCHSLNFVSVKNNFGLCENCFNECYALKKLEFPTPISEIPSGLLSRNWALSNIDFSEVLKIGANGLIYTKIKKLSLPKCAEIEPYACDNMYALTEINAPLCTSIGNDAFSYCHNLREIYAPNCTYVGDRAFVNCYNLEKVTFAENCTFGKYAFSECYSLYPRPDGSIN